jgi:hypothetical protein
MDFILLCQLGLISLECAASSGRRKSILAEAHHASQRMSHSRSWWRAWKTISHLRLFQWLRRAAQGASLVHIVDPELRENHLQRLAEAGIDVEQAMATGQLELRRWQDAYLRDDRFDQDGMLTLLEEVLGSGAAAGNPRIRFVSRVEPSLVDKAGEDNWLEYESRVNYAVSKYSDPVICTYDLTNFSASLVMDMLRVHPVVIVGGVLQENPFFVAPDQFLLELRERKAARSNAIQAHQ